MKNFIPNVLALAVPSPFIGRFVITDIQATAVVSMVFGDEIDPRKADFDEIGVYLDEQFFACGEPDLGEIFPEEVASDDFDKQYSEVFEPVLNNSKQLREMAKSNNVITGIGITLYAYNRTARVEEQRVTEFLNKNYIEPLSYLVNCGQVIYRNGVYVCKDEIKSTYLEDLVALDHVLVRELLKLSKKANKIHNEICEF